MNFREIYEGWKNKLAPEEALKEIIKEASLYRMEICETCDFHSKNHLSIRPDVHCTKCGCTLSAKTACLSCKCPINKWRDIKIE
jgi:hypothetical protein